MGASALTTKQLARAHTPVLIWAQRDGGRAGERQRRKRDVLKYYIGTGVKKKKGKVPESEEVT